MVRGITKDFKEEGDHEHRGKISGTWKAYRVSRCAPLKGLVEVVVKSYLIISSALAKGAEYV